MPPEASQGWPINWPQPPGVVAFMSTRRGGVSAAPFDSFNLGLHVGDDPGAVQINRQKLSQSLGVELAWLNQSHGSAVTAAAELALGSSSPADAVWSTTPGLGCAVLVADCLPVLLSTHDGRAVGAAHAGWRGLAAGVLDNAVAAICREADCKASELQAWLGPCIGPRRFEVGDDVKEAFGPSNRHRFADHRRSDGSSAWLCDLPGLALDRLNGLGVQNTFLSGACTVEDASNFFSFRRDRQTGRMAAVIFRQH
jgi:polyphenol oxidase